VDLISQPRLLKKNIMRTMAGG